MWKTVVSKRALFASSSDDVRSADTRSIVQIALHISIQHTILITVTILTSDDLIKSKSVRLALIALLTRHLRWTQAFTGVFLADRSRWTIAWFTVGESVEASFAGFALTADNVRLTLTFKFIKKRRKHEISQQLKSTLID